MASIPCSWAAYARFQNRLSLSSSMNDRAWGLEGALNVILKPSFSVELAGDEDFRRAAASASRKQRHHLGRFLVTPDADFDPADGKEILAQMVARQALDALEAGVDQVGDQRLLSAVANGEDYDLVAHELGRPEASLRSRMLRLRTRFDHLRP